ncbi:membrane protein containing DUF1295 [Candidatus Magnetoovum chiemensis]|nr:membrane protein containing DUF1295 [Candidatus Magnetoovum chiemensis]
MNRRVVFNSAIALYFILGLEIIIMISPFAGFFYAVFNPFLLKTAQYSATRWLSAFYLPHLIVPPNDMLKFVRVMGSILFVAGISVFILCAVQVYTNKLFKRGTALRGLYSHIRHPQYVGLAVSGIGMSILWPRFLVAVLWILMILIYYFLSKDEEKRMLKTYHDEYNAYMNKTGMFLPKAIENAIAPKTAVWKAAVFLVIATVTVGGAFFMRHYTIRNLPIWTEGNITALSIRLDEKTMMDHRMGQIVQLEEINKRLNPKNTYLVYFMPKNYIMQGLIADTHSEWKLYKQHHTMSMMTDWIFHPFRHLQEGHHLMHEGGAHNSNDAFIRRLIFVQTDKQSPLDVFSINAKREPQFMIDIDVHNLILLDIKELPKETGWGTLPTPVF